MVSDGSIRQVALSGVSTDLSRSSVELNVNNVWSIRALVRDDKLEEA